MHFLSRKHWMLVAVAILGCRATSSTKPQEDQAMSGETRPSSMLAMEELKQRLGRYAKVRIGFDKTGFTPEEQKAIEMLARASMIIDEIFWQQASSQGRELFDLLAEPKDEKETFLKDYLKINYGPYDRLDGMRPFISATPRPAGATFYPRDMMREEFEKHLSKHPEDRDAFCSNFNVIRREAGRLVAVPYSNVYRVRLERAAVLLREAANRVREPSLQKYLRSRADAFLSNDYFQSDLDWLDLDSKLEVTIGPYEVYEDGLFNYKAAFESFLTVRDEQSSRKLASVAGYLTDMENNLPIPAEHRASERGKSSPIAVVDLILSAGDTRAGVQTLAFNLPNDERVRKQKGCKKVLLKNVSHAKYDTILRPIATRVLVDEQLPYLSFEAYFNHTLMHELSHGLGPGFIGKGEERTSVNMALKDRYVAIEEAKADTLGLYNTLYLVERGALSADLRTSGLVTFLAGVFRSVRFGAHEAHGQANVIIFNYLLEGGAYAHEPGSGRFRVVLDRAPDVIRELANEILMIQAGGDYARAGRLIERFGSIRPEMQTRLDTLRDIPVDIVPVFEIEEQMD